MFYVVASNGLIVLLLTIGMSLTHFSNSCFQGIGSNMLFTLISFELSLAIQKFQRELRIDIQRMVKSQWMALAMSISLSAVVGIASNLQLLIMTVVGTICTAINERIITKLGAMDIGHVMTTILFGAIFGASNSIMIWFKLLRPSITGPGKKLHTNPASQLASLISCMLLLIFWPNFISIDVAGDKKHRMIVNLYLSMISATVTSYIAATLVDTQNRFSIVSCSRVITHLYQCFL